MSWAPITCTEVCSCLSRSCLTAAVKAFVLQMLLCLCCAPDNSLGLQCPGKWGHFPHPTSKKMQCFYRKTHIQLSPPKGESIQNMLRDYRLEPQRTFLILQVLLMPTPLFCSALGWQRTFQCLLSGRFGRHSSGQAMVGKRESNYCGDLTGPAFLQQWLGCQAVTVLPQESDPSWDTLSRVW